MQTASIDRPLEFYLKIRDGAYGYVKIAPGLVIGEAEDGELLLNSRRPGERLIQFEGSTDGLSVSLLDPDCELTYWDANVKHAVDVLAIASDVSIKLRHTDLLITEDPLNTTVHRKVKLAQCSVPVLQEPAQPADADNVVSIVPPLPTASSVPEPPGRTRRSALHAAAVAGIAAIGIGMAMITALHVGAGRSEKLEVSELGVPDYATLAPVVSKARVIDPQRMLPMALGELLQTAVPRMLTVPHRLADVPQYRIVEREAHVIKDMLDNGNLLWPEEKNGLTRLTALLGDHSSHPAVKKLFARSAGILATVAEDLFAQGYRFPARDLIETALNVAPDDPRVLALQSRFNEALRRHNGTRLFDNPIEASTSL